MILADNINSAPPVILYEDDRVAIVDKPTGIHSTGKNSLEEIIQAEFNFDTCNDQGEPLLQRLDFETSGCIIIAKTEAAKKEYRKLFSEHKIYKTYVAITSFAGDYNTSLKAHIGSRYRKSKKASICPGPKDRFLYAETDFSLTQQKENFALVRAETNYGRRHQVRAFASYLGFPLIGDELYGGNDILPDFCPKFILHAESLKFNCPFTDKNIKIQADNPSYLDEILNQS